MIYSDQIRDLLERVAIEHKDIQDFYFGDSDEILGAERNNIKYPAFWLESPEISFPNDQDSIVEEYTVTWVVLTNSSKDDTERMRYNKSMTERISKEIILKLKCSQQSEDYSLLFQRTNMYPLDNLNNDNDQGWRVEMTIRPISSDYSFSSSFEQIFPPGMNVGFNWSKDEDTVTIENTVKPSLDAFDSYKWTFIDDGETTEITDNENPDFPTTSDGFYIQLDVTINGHTRTASGHTKNGQSGHSFPFIYNPFR